MTNIYGLSIVRHKLRPENVSSTFATGVSSKVFTVHTLTNIIITNFFVNFQGFLETGVTLLRIAELANLHDGAVPFSSSAAVNL